MRKLPTSFAARLLFGLFVAAPILASRPALAATDLQIHIESHATLRDPDPKKAPPPDTQTDVEVLLADSTIVIKSGQGITVLDFKSRRRLVLDDSTKTYVNYSLFDTVGFRVMEQQNRTRLNDILVAAKINPPPFSTVDNEHIFSLTTGASAKIVQSLDGDSVVFNGAGHPLASWTSAGSETTPEVAAGFAQFLRYRVGGHPDILRQLAAGHRLPDALTFFFYEVWGTRTQTITIKSVGTADWNDAFLQSYALRKAGPTAVDTILDQAASADLQSFSAAKRDNLASNEKAFQENRVFDAFLGWVEANLMSGLQPAPALTADQLAKVRADPSAQKASVAMGASTKESMEASIKVLTELNAQTSNKAYVLGIFEANDRLRMGDAATAQKLFITALQKNIYLAGVYKDLGDLFISQYDTGRAWRCWDLGRGIAPGFANFAPVNQFEKTLVEKHPEYF